jgi:hypothetical protein
MHFFGFGHSALAVSVVCCLLEGVRTPAVLSPIRVQTEV